MKLNVFARRVMDAETLTAKCYLATLNGRIRPCVRIMHKHAHREMVATFCLRCTECKIKAYMSTLSCLLNTRRQFYTGPT